jgi:DNA-directed RNA polymerase subunit RPC12/RpoP
MRKRDLLELPVLGATDQIVRLAKSDRGRLRQIGVWNKRKKKAFRVIYSRAGKWGTVLKVALFCREDLLAGELLPRYEIYISTTEDEDKTYLPKEKKWSEASIGNLIVADGYKIYYGSQMEEWEEPGARETVAKEIGAYSKCAEKNTVFELVLAWQQLRRARRLRGRHQREKARIDLAMETVPDLPKDWVKWVYDSAYFHAQYMMYHPGDKENSAWCSACGFNVKLKKRVRHQEHVRCPKCGKKVLALSWNKQKTISDRKEPGILQERKDGGYVLRVFASGIIRRKETDWKLSESESYIHEKYRVFLDRSFRQETIYEYTVWKTRYEHDEERWCYGSDAAYGYGYYYKNSDDCILYYRNLARLRKGTCLQYVPLEKLFKKNEGCYGSVVKMLSNLKSMPQLEYLIKTGLYRLAWDLAKEGNRGNLLDTDKKNLLKALGVDRQELDMAIKMNASFLQFKTLKAISAAGYRLNSRQVEWYSREFGAEMTKRMLAYGHPVKMMNYISRLTEQGIRPGDYVDYLEEVKVLRLERTEDVLFPKNFQSMHERLSEQRRDMEEEVRKATIRKKDRMLREMLPELIKLYTGTKAEGDFVMILPTCKEDFAKEGQNNHNCVNNYYDKMLEGKCVILFLRKKEDTQSSFCTVEMDGARIVQCRAIRNSVPPLEVTEFMERYAKEVDKRIRRKEAEKAEVEQVLIPAM